MAQYVNYNSTIIPMLLFLIASDMREENNTGLSESHSTVKDK